MAEPRTEDELTAISCEIFKNLSTEVGFKVDMAIEKSSYLLTDEDKEQVKKNIMWMISIVFFPEKP